MWDCLMFMQWRIYFKYCHYYIFNNSNQYILANYLVAEYASYDLLFALLILACMPWEQLNWVWLTFFSHSTGGYNNHFVYTDANWMLPGVWGILEKEFLRISAILWYSVENFLFRNSGNLSGNGRNFEEIAWIKVNFNNKPFSNTVKFCRIR